MKRSQYPAKLKIGKSTYSVELVPLIEETKNNVTRGYCDSASKNITLLSKQSERELFATLLHEMLHAISHEHDIKLKHKLVYALEGPLADALLKNFLITKRR